MKMSQAFFVKLKTLPCCGEMEVKYVLAVKCGEAEFSIFLRVLKFCGLALSLQRFVTQARVGSPVNAGRHVLATTTAKQTRRKHIWPNIDHHHATPLYERLIALVSRDSPRVQAHPRAPPAQCPLPRAGRSGASQCLSPFNLFYHNFCCLHMYCCNLHSCTSSYAVLKVIHWL